LENLELFILSVIPKAISCFSLTRTVCLSASGLSHAYIEATWSNEGEDKQRQEHETEGKRDLASASL